MREPSVVLISRCEAVADLVLAAAAALSVAVEVRGSPQEAAACWAEAAAVFVAEDAVEGMAALGPKLREGVYLVGFDAAALACWSVPLGGQVIVLPEGIAALSAVLSDDRGSGAGIVTVVGGSGGIGASTTAAGLASAAQRRGLAVALVDLDPLGGGLDLLLGAERTPGWRWPRLVGASGEVNDVRRFLPVVDGVTVVAMGRALGSSPKPDEIPSAESVRAVLGSLARHHDLVLLDPGRAPLPAARQVLSSASRSLVVAGSGVRTVAAAAAVLRGLELGEPGLVVRQLPSSPVPADAVGRVLGVPVLASLPHDRVLGQAAERGDPPGRRGRRRWTRAVGHLLDQVMEGRRAR